MIRCLYCQRTKRHHGRGLCNTCYSNAERGGTLYLYPVTKRVLSTDEILDFYVMVRATLSMKEIAERLDMKPRSLARRMTRLRKQGDPRATRKPEVRR